MPPTRWMRTPTCVRWSQWVPLPVKKKWSSSSYQTWNTFECSDRAIITGTNARVDELNSKILTGLDGPMMTLHSATRLDPEHHGRLGQVLTEELLHSLKSPGVPDHNRKLKLNCLCLVMRNISVQDRVMNTKLIFWERVPPRTWPWKLWPSTGRWSSRESCFDSPCHGAAWWWNGYNSHSARAMLSRWTNHKARPLERSATTWEIIRSPTDNCTSARAMSGTDETPWCWQSRVICTTERLWQRTWSTPNFYHRGIGVDEQPLRELRTSLHDTADRYLNLVYSTCRDEETRKKFGKKKAWMWNCLHVAQAGTNQKFHIFDDGTTAKTTVPDAKDIDAHGQRDRKRTLLKDIALHWPK